VKRLFWIWMIEREYTELNQLGVYFEASIFQHADNIRYMCVEFNKPLSEWFKNKYGKYLRLNEYK